MYRGASRFSDLLALGPLHIYRPHVCCGHVNKHREPQALRWSKALRNYMTDHDLTTEQVAVAAGRTRGYVSHRTTGRAPLSLDIILAVAQLSGISERALMIELTDRVGWAPAPEVAGPPGKGAPSAKSDPAADAD